MHRAMIPILVVAFQVLCHFLHRVIPIFRVKGAGFQNDSGQFQAAVERCGDFLAGETTILRFLPLQPAGDFLA